MQAFQQQMKSLRRAIRHLLERIGWLQAAPDASKPSRAPKSVDAADAVSSILDRTAADLRKLSLSGDDNLDASPIIERAVQELGQLGFRSPPFNDQIMDRYLAGLPELDYKILCLFKDGKKHNEIADQMHVSIDTVRFSLIRTYSELRMTMIGSSDDGGGMPSQPPAPDKSTQPMKRTLLQSS